MPELPEVETMVRGIRPYMQGRKLLAFRACPCECRPMTIEPSLAMIAQRVAGLTVTQVRRRAKRVILELSSGEAFVIEPRMTGLMLVDDPPDPDHLRVEWEFADKRDPRSVFFWDRRGLGTIRLMSSTDLARLLSCEYLGRDALDMTLADWTEFCVGTSSPIKVALLNQQRVAGIGNLYASEILHLSGISPLQPARTLKPQQIERLATQTRAVLEDAIKHEGSTLSDGTYRNALNKAGGYQNAHRVYDREGERCPSCQRADIVRMVQAQRSTFYCPACQRLTRSRTNRTTN